MTHSPLLRHDETLFRDPDVFEFTDRLSDTSTTATPRSGNSPSSSARLPGQRCSAHRLPRRRKRTHPGRDLQHPPLPDPPALRAVGRPEARGLRGRRRPCPEPRSRCRRERPVGLPPNRGQFFALHDRRDPRDPCRPRPAGALPAGRLKGPPRPYRHHRRRRTGRPGRDRPRPAGMSPGGEGRPPAGRSRHR